ncbi:MAG: ribonuclease H-like domain-containing protein [Candidatus Thermoplasmatota archaeon]
MPTLEQRNIAYLDIETDWHGNPTIIGIYRNRKMLQLVDEDVTKKNLLKNLEGIDTIYTYWGLRFDIPVIRRTLGIDLKKFFNVYDLADYCHRKGFYGGLKAVEKRLGIQRKTKDMDGRDAIRLWYKYKKQGDKNALRLLLIYNREDTVNLYVLRKRMRLSS